MLKITREDEPITVETLCLTVYSQPGLGKTSLAFTASRPLLLDFDKGVHRAFDRKDAVQVTTWADVADITAADVAGYDTIIIDTVGKALETLGAEIAKTAKYSYGGALNQQGWGQLGLRFSAFLKKLRTFGKDIILIAHMDEKADGDAIKERLKIPGGSKDVVLVDSDVIARISIVNRQRSLVFSPTETAFGKDPAGIGEMPIPDAATPEFRDVMAALIARIKTALNTLSAAQVERKSEVEWFHSVLPDLTTPDDINEVLGRAKKAGRDVAKMVSDHAKNLGFEFDPDLFKYVWPSDAGEEAPPESEPLAFGKSPSQTLVEGMLAEVAKRTTLRALTALLKDKGWNLDKDSLEEPHRLQLNAAIDARMKDMEGGVDPVAALGAG
jgi:hypothetical protein